MNSPLPVTSANSTDGATGLAEFSTALAVAPEAVVNPNWMPPSAAGSRAIQAVSGAPSPSTSTVGAEGTSVGAGSAVAGPPPAGGEETSVGAGSSVAGQPPEAGGAEDADAVVGPPACASSSCPVPPEQPP